MDLQSLVPTDDPPLAGQPLNTGSLVLQGTSPGCYGLAPSSAISHTPAMAGAASDGHTLHLCGTNGWSYNPVMVLPTSPLLPYPDIGGVDNSHQ